jgi:acyl-CoA reductase-like NAD-dependent aldehyde dehydrogenase
MSSDPRSTDVLSHIDGEWISGPETRPNVNPADTREIIGVSAHLGRAEAVAAVEAAHRALPGWRDTPAPKRGAILFEAVRLMKERAELLAMAMTREEGKTLNESRGEVMKSIICLEYMAGEGRRPIGQVVASEMARTMAYHVRQPLGVVSIITPWNFPVAIPTWKIAPALVAGNTVVFKPASVTPLTGRLVAECFIDAGLPKGVLNFVTGGGGTVGDELVGNPLVRGVSFTGSNEIGMALARQATESRKKCQCEMGGKNPMVILADADVELAVDATLQGAFGSTGQRCTATSRVVVDRSVYAEVVERLVAGAKAIKVGNGLDPTVKMGPSVDRGQHQTVLEYIAVAHADGARLVAGGGVPKGPEYEHGFFTEPTVFVDAHMGMRITQEEVFGPILAVVPVDGFDAALEAANGVRYGLSASVYTRDLVLAQRFIDAIEVGIVHVNNPTVGGEAQMPFGGMKDTGVGQREMGTFGVDFFSETKAVYLDYTAAARRTNIY